MHNLGKHLKTLPIWKTKIGPWLKGKVVDDAPKCRSALDCSKPSELYTDSKLLAFRGPFASVTLERSGDGWLARVSGNANPVSAHYADTDEAVKRWAASVWHIAIRGVI